MLHIVLFEPEIPQNTGNIARTCAATRTCLDLVYPLGFDISEKAVRHAGLDYWKDVTIKTWKSTEEFLAAHGRDELWFFTTKALRTYTDVTYPKEGDTYLIFGKESRGIEEEILLRVRKFLYICNVLYKKHRHFICSIATRTRPSTREKRALLYHQRLAPKCRLPIGGIRLA